MFYWTLGNIHAQYRSSLGNIQLYSIVNSADLELSNALEKLLTPMILELKELQQQGIDISINVNKQKNYKGSMLFWTGGTPAQAAICGFKELTSAYWGYIGSILQALSFMYYY